MVREKSIASNLEEVSTKLKNSSICSGPTGTELIKFSFLADLSGTSVPSY